MKVTNQNKTRQGFTLIEMVGVLAIIAILAALLVPKIFAAINESRINNAVASINAVKAGTMSYFGKYGRFAGLQGRDWTTANSGYTANPTAVAPAANWDNVVLVGDGFMERELALRLGLTADVVVSPALAATVAAATDNAAYNLDSSTANGSAANDASAASWVVETTITGVSLEDARELNTRIDGGGNTEAALNDNGTPADPTDDPQGDLMGRVKYSISGGTCAVRIYLAHK